MPIVFTLNGHIGPIVNISAFIAAAQAAPLPGPTGPTPGQLPAGGATVNLGPNKSALQPISPIQGRTLSIGLITTAAEFYVSTDPGAVAGVWVHHTNGGHVTAGDVNNAREGLGNPPWGTIYAVFAHPRPNDPGYTASMNTMAAQGIPANNIIEISNMLVPQIGVNNLGQLGF